MERVEPAAVVVRGLRKRFGAVRAVDGVDLEVPAGQVVALLGPNGAGKTTTVEAMLGLRVPDEGMVRLFGLEPRQALDEGAVGAVLQSGALIQGATVGELIRAVAALYRAPVPVAEVVARAGLDGLLRRRTDRLSGGQAQRVRFALALIGGPRLLVLDEPTAGLDVAARREFWASVREFVAGGPDGRGRRSVLFSTHYLEEADEMADRIVLLNAGRVVADGTAAAIRAVASYRVVRFTLSAVADPAPLELPAVNELERRGDTVVIRSGDSDQLLRALLARYPDARDIEVTAAPLADAFLALTSAGAPAGTEVA